MARPGISIEQIEAALEKSGGLLSHAGILLGRTRQAIHNRVVKSKRLQLKVAECRELTLDDTESALIRKIRAEDLGAICFYLKCQGKQRGYIEQPTPPAGSTNLAFDFLHALQLLGSQLKMELETRQAPKALETEHDTDDTIDV